VKRVMLGMAATVVAATAAVLVPQAAGATGGSTPTTEISINERVDYDTFGSQLDVGGAVKCTSAVGEGTITASVSQAPPETPSPVTLSTGNSFVVCDGKWHTFALTAIGAGFDAGRAKATVTVMPVAGSPTKTATRWVTVVNV
jgi:hypothetical protein